VFRVFRGVAGVLRAERSQIVRSYVKIHAEKPPGLDVTCSAVYQWFHDGGFV